MPETIKMCANKIIGVSITTRNLTGCKQMINTRIELFILDRNG